MPRLFRNRQAAHSTERGRFQVNYLGAWVDIPGVFSLSGGGGSAIEWRTDGPHDRAQVQERGKEELGTFTCESRAIPFHPGWDAVRILQETGETTSFRMNYQGSPLLTNNQTGSSLQADIAAAAAIDAGTHNFRSTKVLSTVTVSKRGADAAAEAALNAHKASNLIGPNAAIIVAENAQDAQANPSEDLADISVFTIVQPLTDLTFAIDAIPGQADLAASADRYFQYIKVPYFLEFLGYVQTSTQNSPQEAPVDESLTIRMSGRPARVLDKAACLDMWNLLNN